MKSEMLFSFSPQSGENSLVRGDVGVVDLVQERGILREDRRGQSKRCSGLMLHPRQCGGGIFLQKIVERHIQTKRLGWQCG